MHVVEVLSARKLWVSLGHREVERTEYGSEGVGARSRWAVLRLSLEAVAILL
jgi:hypothetical protein